MRRKARMRGLRRKGKDGAGGARGEKYAQVGELSICELRVGERVIDSCALQAPLQPLQDNLESQTYETFEKDPVLCTC